jgi:hypothetical protein
VTGSDGVDLENLLPVEPETQLALMPYLLEQLVPLLKAYDQGMIVARTPEEEAILADIDATSGRTQGES